jgi:Family of unknown function (DUF6527)
VKPSIVDHVFVEFVPDYLEPGVLYISIPYKTILHNCLCGCGYRVATPLSPTDWALTFDGDTVSLAPSIGNWSFPCRSHYIIKKSKIIWAGGWSQERVDAARARDRQAKTGYYNKAPVAPSAADPGLASKSSGIRWWRRLWNR